MPVETETIISHLEELEKKEGPLPPLLEFYHRLTRAQHSIEERLGGLPRPTLDGETIRKRLEAGRPLISFDELVLDQALLEQSFASVTAFFAEYPQLFGTLPEAVTEANHSLVSRNVLKAWYDGEALPHTVPPAASRSFVANLLHATLKPFLVAHAKKLRDAIEQERWRRPYCPICRGGPDFAFLDKEHGARWLVCSRCDTEWLFQRLECPFCGNQDQSKLGYLTDETDVYRLYVCEKCLRYLKAIDLRQTKSEVLLPLERFYTADLDRQAREQGYVQPDLAT